ncbi:MAG: MBL fold metallo-hydrolase [Alphaproteobacteria bacterium]
MTNSITILGSGAAPGVPSLSHGFGDCDPKEKKNIRTRTTTYFEYNDVKFLIDTSPDLRLQLIDNNIKHLDAVLYTHAHADHINGIDDLREINRIMQKPLNIYGASKTLKTIKKYFPYLMSSKNDVMNKASLIQNKMRTDKTYSIKDLRVTTIKLDGHAIPSYAYIFNDGEVVYLSDCKDINEKILKAIKTDVKILVLPLTNPFNHDFHMGIDKLKEIVKKINPKQTIINHMSTNCDYNKTNNLTDSNIFPSYDGMKVEF